MSLGERVHALDRLQQRHRWLAFPAGVIKKFGDDEAGSMAALIAYYGFVSLFPLLLVLVTVLGFVLEGDRKTQEEVLHSTLSQFPIIGDQLESNVHSLKGSVGALAIGVAGLLLGGLGIVGATQNAFQQVWHIPRKRRPNFLAWRLRGIWLLAVLGLLLVISTVAAGYVTAQMAGPIAVLGGVLVALASNLLLFFAAFRFLSPDEIQTHDLLA
ncbi:MAG TPA: YhjD/YihY/BrkB family envelope integrity protein, partial [Solirubrobacteraceae bacterium]